MAQLNVYLFFNGNCLEAMEFYHSCFGGELQISTFGESPGAEKFPDTEQNLVMHAHLTNGKFNLMASDIGSQHPSAVTGTSISLSLNCESAEEITTLFNAVSAGGKINQPLQKQFWGATFGMFTDRFGMPWMMNFDHTPKA